MTRARFDRRIPVVGPTTTRGRQFSIDMGELSVLRELRAWLRPVRADDELSAYLAAPSQQRMRQVPEEVRHPRRLDQIGSEFTVVAAVQLVWDDEFGERIATRPLGRPPRGADGRIPAHDVATHLDVDDVVNGLHGTWCWGHVTSIGLITQLGELPALGSDLGETLSQTLASMVANRRVTAGARVSGLIGSSDRGGLIGLGLRCSVDGVGPTDLAVGDGRFVTAVDLRAHPVHEDPPIGASADEPRPRFLRRDVWHVDQWDDIMTVSEADGSRRDYRFDRAEWDPVLERPVDIYLSSDETEISAMPAYGARRARISGVTSGLDALVEPIFPERPAADSPGWSNVFSLEHRPAFLAFLFNGLNTARLNPFDLQDTTGAIAQPVFAAPTSEDGYHVAESSPMIVPDGWHVVVDRTGSTSVSTVSTTTAEETRSSWEQHTCVGGSIGASVGEGAGGSGGTGGSVAFQASQAAHAAFGASNRSGTTTTVNRVVTRDHYVVVDLSQVTLDAEFHLAVSELATLAEEVDDRSPWSSERRLAQRIEEFLRRFGSHYVFGLTYGSTSFEHRYYSTSDVTATRDSGTSHEESVKADFKAQVGVANVHGSVSVSGGGSNTSGSTDESGQAHDTTGIVTIGSEGSPVPVMLDVEPITNLLSPIFFRQPAVHRVLRPLVEAVILERGRAIFGGPPSVEPSTGEGDDGEAVAEPEAIAPTVRSVSGLADGRVDVFWVGDDGVVSQLVNRGVERNYTNVTSETPASTPMPLTGFSDHRIDVFWAGSDGTLRNAVGNGDDPWRTSGLRGEGLTSAPAPLTGVWNGRMDVFWRGRDGSLNDTHWIGGANGSWGTSRLSTAPMSSDPAPLAGLPERIDVFWLGANRHIYDTFWNGAKWVVEEVSREPAVYGPAPAAGFDAGRMDVFWVDEAGQLRDMVGNGRQWGPHLLPGEGVMCTPVPVTGFQPNRIDVFWTGPDGGLWTTWWNGSKWQAAHLFDIPMSTAPTASHRVVQGVAQIDVFFRIDTGSLMHAWSKGVRWEIDEVG